MSNRTRVQPWTLEEAQDAEDALDAYITALNEAERALGHLRSQGGAVMRKARGPITQRKLADRCGISVPYVSQLEHGVRDPSMNALIVLLDLVREECDALRARA